jgi:hypothetical protein
MRADNPADACYPVINASSFERDRTESMGTKKKFWCRDPGDNQYLFKYSRENTGEDWAEKIAAEVAAALGVPHATVDLALCDERRGTLTLAFTSEALPLVHGNELLQERHPAYPAHARYEDEASAHTLSAVLGVLAQPFVHPPSAGVPALATAADWLVGYLMLDALIGNTDRHHENWGVLVWLDRSERFAALAPSYDHASSLGRELRDTRRTTLLGGKGPRHSVAAYAKRARSALYRSPADAHPMSTLDACREVMKERPSAGQHWLERIEALDDDILNRIVDRVPQDRMSDLSRAFAVALMVENRRSLLRLREPVT